MSIAAIPTRYAGVQFRSRLEAKWAAFFDFVGWQWAYEPEGFDGWIPDFALLGLVRAPAPGAHRLTPPLLVEVKPIDGFPSETILELSLKAPGREILIVGQFPFRYFADIGPQIGWLREGDCATGRYPDYLGWGDACVCTIRPSGEIGIVSADGDFTDRISGEYDGDHHIGPLSCDAALSMWNEAGNRVQWKRPA